MDYARSIKLYKDKGYTVSQTKEDQYTLEYMYVTQSGISLLKMIILIRLKRQNEPQFQCGSFGMSDVPKY